MIRIDTSVWFNLFESAKGDQLAARLAAPEVTQRLLCAVDSMGNRHFLVPLVQSDDDYTDLNSRGIRVVTRQIECLDKGGHDAFDLIGGEILNGLETGLRPPSEVIKGVLSKWRRFWGQVPNQILSKERQIGLFAELWFLTKWLIPKFGSDGIRAWTGPTGNRHDFQFPHFAIEVKATTSSRGRIHKIHGINQLEEPASGMLAMFSMRLREDNTSNYSLPGIMELCIQMISKNEEDLLEFESLLTYTGYLKQYQDEYEKLKLTVVEECLFLVNDNFPRITPDSFPAGLTPGIENLEYEINLNTFDHLITAHTPDEMKNV